MLTEKDYCDYDTCVALKELGYKVPTSAFYIPNNETLYFVSNPYRGGYVIDCFRSHNSFPKDVMTNDFIDAPTMWEAQKWLREKEGLFVNVELFGDYDRDADGKTLGTWVYYSYGILNTTTADFIREYDLCTEYQTYEEALLEGVKCALKILKENETIHE